MKPLINKKLLYILVNVSRPIIVNNKFMFHDNRKGGELLQYNIYEVKTINIFNSVFVIHNTKYVVDNKYFFRPLKRDWNRNSYKISKIYWGKKNHLLTNYWLEVDSNFKDIFSINKEELKKFKQCKDKKLINNLNSHKEEFLI